MPATADRCKETSTTTGVGTFTLDGAVSQFQSFAVAFGSSSRKVMYAIVAQSFPDWEVGKGTFNGTTSLTRDVVRSSSNANGLVNFNSGPKEVFATFTAEQADNCNIGLLIAQFNGQAMP